MVRIALPPPSLPPNLLFRVLPTGTALVRLFDPVRHGATALSFRYFGPLLRFDHHRAGSGMPAPDPLHGIYYAGLTLSGCVVEVFGDTGLIDCGEWWVAMPRLTRDLMLLDLRGSGAMRAGSVAALSKVPDHAIAQAWSRHIHGAPEYRQPDGLLWSNAHNDEEAIGLYARSEASLACPPDMTIRLDSPSLRPTLAQIAEANGLILAP